MSKNTFGTTPDTRKLHDLIDQLSSDIAASNDGSVTIDQEEAQTLVDTAIWCCNFLNDRRIYHKKQQVKKRMIEKLVREKLSQKEIDELSAAAKAEAERTVLPTTEVDGEGGSN